MPGADLLQPLVHPSLRGSRSVTGDTHLEAWLWRGYDEDVRVKPGGVEVHTRRGPATEVWIVEHTGADIIGAFGPLQPNRRLVPMKLTGCQDRRHTAVPWREVLDGAPFLLYFDKPGGPRDIAQSESRKTTLRQIISREPVIINTIKERIGEFTHMEVL
jgi:hypothetical protein